MRFLGFSIVAASIKENPAIVGSRISSKHARAIGRCFLSACAILTAGAADVAVAQAVSPILHYRLEDAPGTTVTTVVDDANGNNGTAVGDPFYVADDPGLGATSVDFTVDRIVFGSISQLGTLAGDLTVELIFKPRTVAGSQQQFLVSNWPFGSGFQFACALTTSGMPSCSFSDGVSGHIDSATSPTPVLANQWYHFAAVRDAGTGEVRVYVNGSLVDSNPLQYSLSSVNSAFSIGARFNNSLYFDGLIAEVRITDSVVDPQDFLLFSQPIPTLSAAALGVLSILLASAGTFLLRAQRRNHSSQS